MRIRLFRDGPVPRREAILLTSQGLAVALMLTACGSDPALQEQLDAENKARARRPYQPADSKVFEAIINSYREKNGLAPWSVDERLNTIATKYAERLAQAHQMTHDLPPFGGLEKRLKDAGYVYLVAGENLGEGYSDMQDAFNGWRRSPPHDRGMRDPDATVFGIGSAFRDDDRYQTYWCLNFAKPRTIPTQSVATTVPG